MRRKIRYVTIAVVALVVIAWAAVELLGRNAQTTSAAPPPMPTVAVTLAARGPLSTSITLSGAFKPYQEVDVHAKVAGYVRRIYVDVGDKVHQGQTLAVLEVPELTAQVAGANADIRRSEDAIHRAEQDLRRAESSYAASHAAYTRLKQAAESRPGLIAAQELDDSLARDQEADAQVGSARAALAEAQSQHSAARANEERYATLEGYARITAPFSGVVTKRYADTGSLIQAGTASDTQAMPVVRIAEWSRLRLVVPVPESAVPNLHPGQAIDVTVPALNRTIKGTIARLAEALDEQTRTMHTEIDVENPAGTLVGGMYAETTLVLNQKADALTVPVQAVKREGSSGTLLVVDGSGMVAQRPVTLGAEGRGRIEILRGLATGEQVIVGNGSGVEAGQRVHAQVLAVGDSTGEEQN